MNEKTKVLVVDDEEPNRVVLQDILELHGYEIIQAADGEEALNKIQENPPDVILLDINMPRMNGIEVTQKIKADERLKHISLIILTGLDDMELRVRALQLGADDFLLKPPHMAELVARVRSSAKLKAYHDHLLDYQKELQLFL